VLLKVEETEKDTNEGNTDLVGYLRQDELGEK
jgi:hypothetical protein